MWGEKGPPVEKRRRTRGFPYRTDCFFFLHAVSENSLWSLLLFIYIYFLFREKDGIVQYDGSTCSTNGTSGAHLNIAKRPRNVKKSARSMHYWNYCMLVLHAHYWWPCEESLVFIFTHRFFTDAIASFFSPTFSTQCRLNTHVHNDTHFSKVTLEIQLPVIGL